MSLNSGNLDTRAGAIHYVRAGAGAPLLLLHGNGHSWQEFADVIAPLASRYDVIAWDMPGHGRSADALAGASAADHAAALGDLIDGLKLERPAIAGSSIGAFIAAEAAAVRADISAIVLQEMQCRPRAAWVAAWPVVQAMFGGDAHTREQVQARFTRTVDEAMVAEWNESRARAGASVMLDVMAAIRDFDLAGVLGRVRAPMLLLYGDNGPVVETKPAMQALLPGVEAKIVANAGHFISRDQPEAFVDAVCAFLDRASETKRSV